MFQITYLADLLVEFHIERNCGDHPSVPFLGMGILAIAPRAGDIPLHPGFADIPQEQPQKATEFWLVQSTEGRPSSP